VAVTVKLKHVVKRGEIYHFRMGIPKALQPHYGALEHTASLHTSDELEAFEKSRALSTKYKAEHRSLRPQQPSIDIPSTKSMSRTSFDLSKIEHFANLLSDDLTGMTNEELKSLSFKLESIRSELKYALENGLTVELLERTRLHPLLNKTFLDLCQQIVGDKKLSDGVLRRKTARAIIPKLQNMLIEIEDKIPPLMGLRVIPETEPILVNGQWMEAEVCNPNAAKSVSTPPEPLIKKMPLLSEVVADCVETLKSNPKAKNAFSSRCKLVIEWCGDKPVNQYTTAMLREFVDNCLLKIPRNMTQSKMWRDLPLKKRIEECSDEDQILPRTSHNYVTTINTVFLHAIYEDLIHKNPARKLTARLPAIDNRDRSYSHDEIKKMLSHLEYENAYAFRYWVTLIGLFTGARLNEICQLRVSDIPTVDGVDCIDINNKDAAKTLKTVKNGPSIRLVPLHPTLVDYGLKNYAKAVHSLHGADSLLFPELQYNKYSGYYRSFSRWFNEKLKPKFLDPGNTTQNGFHSIRNTFIKQAQNQANMQDRAIMEMTGHQPRDVSDIHVGYSGKLKPDRLIEEMKKLDYGLDISSNPYQTKKIKKRRSS
jgi:integrase